MNDIINKGFLSKIRKQLIQRDNEKASNPNEKRTEALSRPFSRKDTRCLRETQIRAARRRHLTLVRITVVRKPAVMSSGDNERGDKGAPLHRQRECELAQRLCTAAWRFLKKLKTEPRGDPPAPPQGLYPDKAVNHGASLVAQR